MDKTSQDHNRTGVEPAKCSENPDQEKVPDYSYIVSDEMTNERESIFSWGFPNKSKKNRFTKLEQFLVLTLMFYFISNPTPPSIKKLSGVWK